MDVSSYTLASFCRASRASSNIFSCPGCSVQGKLIPFSFELDRVGKYEGRNYDTIYLGPSRPSDVHRLWNVSSAVGYAGSPFVPHLTLCQGRPQDDFSAFLQAKTGLLLEQVIQWDVCSGMYTVGCMRCYHPPQVGCRAGTHEIYEEISISSGYPPP